VEVANSKPIFIFFLIGKYSDILLIKVVKKYNGKQNAS